MRPSDLHNIRSVGSVAIRPGSTEVVHAVSWPDLDTDSNRSQLWVHNTDGSRQLTHGHADGSPRFAPSGQRLAFLRSEPDSKPALMVLDWGPGEPREIGTFPDGVSAFRWIDDRRVAVLAAGRPTDQIGVDDDELARRPRIIKSLNYRFNGRGWIHDRKQQVHVVDSESGSQERVSNPDHNHSGLAVDPTGEWIASIVGTDDSDLTGVEHIWVCRVDGSDAEQVTRTDGAWEALCWHPDGRLVANGTTTVARIGFSFLHRFDRNGSGSWGTPVRLGSIDVNIDSFGAGAPVAVPGAVIAAGNVRGSTVLHRYPLDGSEPTLSHVDSARVGSFDASADGSRLVAAITSPTLPPELWDLSGAGPERLTTFNDDLLSELDLVSPETVEIESSDGAIVEAWIHRPPASAQNSAIPGPGLVYIHGGPMTQYGYGFFDEFQLAAAEGFTVIAGNPRGSDGYGERWATCIAGNMGQHDFDDISAIADHLASLPEVDEKRIGIGGGSYGGFMTAWAIGHTDRFAAALVERAVTNWETFSGTTDIPYFVALYTGTTIEDDVEAIRRQSPITHAASVTTPTLVLHSEEDWRCPIEQGEQFFAALRRNGCKVTMARFPAENHELSRGGSPKHRVERFQIVHGFFHHHLD